MSKPREFYVGPSISGWTGCDSYKVYEIMHPNPESAIHVIEKSAYDMLKDAYEMQRKVSESYKARADKVIEALNDLNIIAESNKLEPVALFIKKTLEGLEEKE